MLRLLPESDQNPRQQAPLLPGGGRNLSPAGTALQGASRVRAEVRREGRIYNVYTGGQRGHPQPFLDVPSPGWDPDPTLLRIPSLETAAQSHQPVVSSGE